MFFLLVLRPISFVFIKTLYRARVNIKLIYSLNRAELELKLFFHRVAAPDFKGLLSPRATAIATLASVRAAAARMSKNKNFFSF